MASEWFIYLFIAAGLLFTSPTVTWTQKEFCQTVMPTPDTMPVVELQRTLESLFMASQMMINRGVESNNVLPRNQCLWILEGLWGFIGGRKREACSFKYRRTLFGNLKERKKEAFVREEGKGEWIPPPLTFPLPSPGWDQQFMFSPALGSLRFILKLQGNEQCAFFNGVMRRGNNISTYSNRMACSGYGRVLREGRS